MNLLLAVFTNEHPNGIFSTDNIPVFNGNYVPSKRIIACLKHLKERYAWKPSDDQMDALAWALSLAKNCGEECAFELNQLQEQLKKLREA